MDVRPQHIFLSLTSDLITLWKWLPLSYKVLEEQGAPCPDVGTLQYKELLDLYVRFQVTRIDSDQSRSNQSFDIEIYIIASFKELWKYCKHANNKSQKWMSDLTYEALLRPMRSLIGWWEHEMSGASQAIESLTIWRRSQWFSPHEAKMGRQVPP